MKQFSLTWQATEQDHGKLLRDFLQTKQISRSALTAIKYHGGTLMVNQQPVCVRYPLKTTDSVCVVFPTEKVNVAITGENIPLEILYEDDYLLIVNKPAFMNTIPSREHPTGSLAHALVYYYEKIQLNSTIHIVTRLDRNTSGLVLIAKHRHIHHLLSIDQKQNLIESTYEAIVSGDIAEQSGMIEAPIARKTSSIIEREVHHSGQYACTVFKKINAKHYLQNQTATHLRLQLKTGRTHQIRVHTAYIGHPIIGDSLYGTASELIDRQALHCRHIRFTHPILQKRLQFQASYPKDFKRLL